MEPSPQSFPPAISLSHITQINSTVAGQYDSYVRVYLQIFHRSLQLGERFQNTTQRLDELSRLHWTYHLSSAMHGTTLDTPCDACEPLQRVIEDVENAAKDIWMLLQNLGIAIRWLLLRGRLN